MTHVSHLAKLSILAALALAIQADAVAAPLKPPVVKPVVKPAAIVGPAADEAPHVSVIEEPAFVVEDYLFDATMAWRKPYAITAYHAKTVYGTKSKKVVVPAESKAQHEARRHDIVRDVWRVASDPNEAPIFDEPHARVKTALYMLSVMYFESSYDLRTDRYHCFGQPAGYCDGGAAWCMGQIHTGPTGYIEGHRGPELLKDRVLCARTQLHILQQSKRMCAKETEEWRFFMPYASGSCGIGDIMKSRYDAWSTWLAANPLPTVEP